MDRLREMKIQGPKQTFLRHFNFSKLDTITMKVFIGLVLFTSQLCSAIPRPVIKQSLNQSPLEYFKNDPYSREWKDPYDKKIDSYGKGLQPLPYRNGDGSTILGPQNRDRQRQNPDMMRPPSTDHGDLKNMRWSFADSHVRIEVSSKSSIKIDIVMADKPIGRRMDSANHDARASDQFSARRSEHAPGRRRDPRIALA